MIMIVIVVMVVIVNARRRQVLGREAVEKYLDYVECDKKARLFIKNIVINIII